MTPKASATERPSDEAAKPPAPGQVSRSASARPVETGRYTRPAPKARFRPRWHRLAGWAGVAVGVAIFALNEGMRFGDNLTLLPFGHSPLYLILALGVAGSSTWFLGMFDRETTVYL